VIEPDDRAARDLRDHVVVDERRACARGDRHADAGKGIADDIAGDRHITQILAPAGDDAEGRHILDHIAGDGSIRLDIDADAAVIVRCGEVGLNLYLAAPCATLERRHCLARGLPGERHHLHQHDFAGIDQLVQRDPGRSPVRCAIVLDKGNMDKGGKRRTAGFLCCLDRAPA
jgi:hypothetical protein